MEAWRSCWRQGFAPQFSEEELLALKDGLERDDQALLQAQTTDPPPLKACRSDRLSGGCLVTYAGWKGLGFVTVGEAEDFFYEACRECARRLGEEYIDCGFRWFLNAYDELPRDMMRREMIAEIDFELDRRQRERDGRDGPEGVEVPAGNVGHTDAF